MTPVPPDVLIQEPITSRTKLIVGLIIAAVLVLIGGATTAALAAARSAAAGPTAITVTIRVSGNGPATIRYGDGGELGDAVAHAVPWTTTVSARRGEHVAVEATPVQPGGSATCAVTINDQVIATDTTHNTAEAAECDATVA